MKFPVSQPTIPWTLCALCLRGAVFVFLLAAHGQEAELAIPYQVAVRGVEGELKTLLSEVSETIRLKGRPPPTKAMLRWRANQDVGHLRDALQSRGYFEAAISVSLDDQQQPLAVVFDVAPGAQYTLDKVVVILQTPEGVTPPEAPSREELALPPGAAALARPILDAEALIVRRLRESGYPFPKLKDRDAVTDATAHTLSVTFTVETGPAARFGDTQISGLETVREEFVRARLPWSMGDPYDIRLINEARKKYAALGVFSLAEVSTAKDLPEDGVLPVELRFVERLHRSVAGGLSFETDTGAGAVVSWEHRNLTGRADRFKAELGGNAQQYGLHLKYGLDEFRRHDQSFIAAFDAGEEHPDAFDSRFFKLEGTVSRKLNPSLTLGAGLRLKFATVESDSRRDRNNQYSYLLTGFPLQAILDHRDDPVDPHSGQYSRLEVTPYLGAGDTDPFFLKLQGELRHFWKTGETTTLATRLALGTTLVAGLEGVPFDERYFSGGASSVRGYPLKSLAPRDKEGEPIGGNSYAEFSIEVRRRLNKTLGLVWFLDGGTAFESTIPDFGEKLRWGSGVGARIFTPAGPMRLDIAVPLNPRSGRDSDFQIYASFGHSF